MPTPDWSLRTESWAPVEAPATRPALKTIEKPKKKLSDAVARFNAANDAVNASFRTAEAYLDGLSLGFGAFVKVSEDNFAPEHYGWAEGEYPGDTFEETFLAYEPVGDRLRITILTERSTIIHGEISASSTVRPHVPWDHVGESEKRGTVAKLPDLFDALAREVEFRAEVAEEQSAAADALFSRIS